MKKNLLVSIISLAAAGMMLCGVCSPARAAVGDVVNWYWGRAPHWYGGLTIKYEGDEMYICENESASGYIFIMQPNEVAEHELDTVETVPLGIAKDAGIAWDGDQNVWWVSGANWYFGIGRLPEDGGNFNCSWITGHGVNPYGLDYHSPSRELYIGSSVNTNVIVYDVSTTACPPTFSRYINVGITPIAVTRAGDYLWVSDANSPYGTYKFDLNGTYQNEYFLLPADAGGNRESLSLEFDGRYVWSRSNNNGNGIKIFQIDVGIPPTPTPSPITTPTPVQPILDSGDYDGDTTSDLAIYRPSIGIWAVRGITRVYYGATADIPASGDYDGDGTTDLAVFRPLTSLWAVRGVTRLYYGAGSDIPVPGDYDGDGTCDAGIFRSASGLWAVKNVTRSYYGGASDRPVPVYAEGRDAGKNIGIFRPASGLWAIKGVTRAYFGGTGDQPIAGNYTDTPDQIDIGIFRPTTGLWAVKGITRSYYGASADIPVPANYTGFIPENIGIFRDSVGLWSIKGVTRVYYGADGDIPVSGLSLNPSSAMGG